MNRVTNAFRSPYVLAAVSFMGIFAAGMITGIVVSGTGAVPLGAHSDANLLGRDIAVDLEVDYGNGDVQAFPREIVLERNTVFDLLKAVEQRHGVQLDTRNFPGVGIFIEGINGVRNTNTMYWQFWVNDEYAQVGASQYILKGGDRVLWKRTGNKEGQ